MGEQTTEKLKSHNTSGDNGKRNDEAVVAKEGKFKEIPGERPEKHYGHNSKDDNKEGGTQFVEWSWNPIDKNKINNKGDKYRRGGELVVWEIIDSSNDGKSNHAKWNRETDGERVGENIGNETIFDAIGVFF